MTTAEATVPLLGLFDDVLLPGETRRFTVPALDHAALAAVAQSPPRSLCVVSITAALELPSLVSGRWVTLCDLVEATPDALTLRGVSRRRLKLARGRTAPFAAELTPDTAEGPPDLASLLPGARALLVALDGGARPDRPDATAALTAALRELLRACCAPHDLRDALSRPQAETFEQVARGLATQSASVAASETLEQAVRALIEHPSPTAAQQRRLWSQVVEIQRRLDVYDPSVGAEEGDEVARLQRRVMQAGAPRAAREVARRHLKLLRSMKADHHDYSTYIAHLDLMARLPWLPAPDRPVDLDAVRRSLDRHHTGLDAPKRRVLEYLAVRDLGGESRSTVLCLAGPPGVGKTTIAKAIAEALGRKYIRVALGGMHDESELRGHRITYTAAQPGRIVSGIAEAGTTDVLMLLDEVDKMGTDRARSPAAAMLEVLDPAQNDHFHDNYLGVPYDLSEVLFVCTANDLSQLHPTLRDRMEVVELDGYTQPEKRAIARNNLLQRLRVRTGLPRTLPMDDDVIDCVIEGYTREAGVRQLERALEGVYRGRALELVSQPDRKAAEDAVLGRAVTAEEVRKVLGPGRPRPKMRAQSLPVGVAMGLSVGGDGGATLRIEAARTPAHGRPELSSTGSLGEVLRESVQTALTHLRAHGGRYGLDAERLRGVDFHVHLPEGAVPKDGPSAGVAIVMALASLALGSPVRPEVAFTGEVTLNGAVLPVGGVRLKALAAERAGIETVVVPRENLHEVPAEVRVKVVGVESIDEVFPVAFEGWVSPEGAA